MFVKKSCETCEVLKFELSKAHDLNKRLLDKILEKAEVPKETEIENPQPIGNQYMPWRVKQQMLEKDDRERFKALQDAKVEYKETSELEREVGIS